MKYLNAVYHCKNSDNLPVNKKTTVYQQQTFSKVPEVVIFTTVNKNKSRPIIDFSVTVVTQTKKMIFTYIM